MSKLTRVAVNSRQSIYMTYLKINVVIIRNCIKAVLVIHKMMKAVMMRVIEWIYQRKIGSYLAIITVQAKKRLLWLTLRNMSGV